MLINEEIASFVSLSSHVIRKAFWEELGPTPLSHCLPLDRTVQNEGEG